MNIADIDARQYFKTLEGQHMYGADLEIMQNMCDVVVDAMRADLNPIERQFISQQVINVVLPEIIRLSAIKGFEAAQNLAAKDDKAL